jgi:hypothetical protein
MCLTAQPTAPAIPSCEHTLVGIDANNCLHDCDSPGERDVPEPQAYLGGDHSQRSSQAMWAQGRTAGRQFKSTTPRVAPNRS